MISFLKRQSPAAIAFILFVAAHLGFVLSHWHGVPLHENAPTGQTDPDTWLRLTLVRNWIMSGHWYDHTVWHSNAPFAANASPWTRPVDVVIRFFTALQPADVELNLRLIRAGLLLPVLWMGLLLLALQRAAHRLLPVASTGVMAAILLVLLQPMWNYFTLGNADHHAALAMLFTWVVANILVEKPSRARMLLTGALLALQLWISVETLILIACIYVLYGAEWLLGNRDKIVELSWLSLGTALATLAAVLIERPQADWLTPIYDSISLMHAIVLAFTAAAVWMLRLAPTRNLYDRIAIALLAGALLLLAIACSYPHFFAGPMYGVTPFILSDFLPRISEAKPFYRIDVLSLLANIMVPIIALIFCLAPWIRPPRALFPKATSGRLAYLLLMTIILYYCQQRWSYYMLPLGIIALAPFFAALFTPEHEAVRNLWPANTLAHLSPNAQMKKRLPIICMMAIPTAMLLLNDTQAIHNLRDMLLHSTHPNETHANLSKLRSACYNDARKLIRSGELVKIISPGDHTFLISTDLGTEILFFTPYRIVASNYHREGDGIEYVWSTNKITQEAALRAHLQKREINMILLCPTIEFVNNSLLDAYYKGKKLPHWLHQIPYQLPKTAEGNAQESTLESNPLLLQVLSK